MILNLPPTKAFHLDTLSSLNFANRTKKIEVREIENEPIFKGPPRPPAASATNGGVTRQPLRPLNSAANANILANRDAKAEKEKPAKLFSVYADRSKPTATARAVLQKSSPLKRNAADALSSSRPVKQFRPTTSTTSLLRKGPPETTTITKATLESLVERKVAEILASREANVSPPTAPQQLETEREKTISAEVQARLDSIEKRLEGQEGERAEGLSFLFMAKQHQARCEDSEALRMYEMAQPFFPGNEKLEKKIEKMKAKILARRREDQTTSEDDTVEQAEEPFTEEPQHQKVKKGRKAPSEDPEEAEESYQAHETEESYQNGHEKDPGYADNESPRPRKKASKKRSGRTHPRTAVRPDSPDPLIDEGDQEADHSVPPAAPTPRTQYLIYILNSRSVSKLKALNGLGVKKAEAIVQHLQDEEDMPLNNWDDVLGLDVRGIGKRSWEVMREGVFV